MGPIHQKIVFRERTLFKLYKTRRIIKIKQLYIFVFYIIIVAVDFCILEALKEMVCPAPATDLGEQRDSSTASEQMELKKASSKSSFRSESNHCEKAGCSMLGDSSIVLKGAVRNWERFASLISALETGNNSFNKSLLFTEHREYGIILDPAIHKKCYETFRATASDSETIQHFEIESFLLKLIAENRSEGVNLDEKMLKSVLEKSDYGEVYSFEMVLELLGKVVSSKSSGMDRDSGLSLARLRRCLPLNPDSVLKQSWDFFCLVLLLYCSFYVPFNLAFDNSSPGDSLRPTDILDIFINTVFMLDIALTFATSYYDNQGCLVKDLDKIAQNYCKGWLIPDLAGSFPFDTVISAAMRAQGAGQSANLGAMKIIRMLKLTRAARFVSKLNKIKESADFSMLGPIISLVSAMFLLIFAAHLLGCFFFMFVALEPDKNWMMHYDATLLDGNVLDRYGNPPPPPFPPRNFWLATLIAASRLSAVWDKSGSNLGNSDRTDHDNLTRPTRRLD